MASPSTAITRLELSMSRTEFDVEANRQGFVGLRVLPAVGVTVPALANFPIVPTRALLTPIEDTTRANDGTYKRLDFDWDKGTYSTEEHGVEEELDDHQVKVWGQMVQMELTKSRRGVNRLLQDLENTIAAKVFNETTFSTHLTSVTHGWSSYSNAAPIEDGMTACKTVQDNCGRMANAAVIPRLTLRNWSLCAEVISRYKGLFGNDAALGERSSGKDGQGIATQNLAMAFKAIYDLEYVFVADGMKNTAGNGQTAAFGRYWNPDYCLFFHHNPSTDLMRDPNPCLGKTCFWSEESASIPGDDDGETSVVVEEYREEGRRGSVMRFRNQWGLSFQRAEVGQLLKNLTGNT